MKIQFIRLLVGLFILAMPINSWALEYSWGQIHGFASIGYLKSYDNNFLTPDSQDGTFEINEFGINFNSNITDKLRIGAQLLSRDLGVMGNNDLRIDWALADYRFHDIFGIRAGKVKIPMGLYNTERDTDFLRPMVFLPQSIYDETRRDLVFSHLGGEFYGNVPIKKYGDLDYHLFAGEISFDDDSLLAQAFTNNAKSIAKKMSLGPVNSLELENNYMLGAAIVYNSAFDGLRLGASFMRADNDIYINGLKNGKLDMKGKLILSLEYLKGPFTFSTEYGQTHRIQRTFNVTNIDGKTLEWYALLSYSLTEKASLSVLYEEFYRDQDDKDGNYFIQRGKPAYYAWRKDLGFGIRYDFTNNWTLKGDWHFIDGASLFMDVLNQPVAERYWDYWVIKVSFNF